MTGCKAWESRRGRTALVLVVQKAHELLYCSLFGCGGTVEQASVQKKLCCLEEKMSESKRGTRTALIKYVHCSLVRRHIKLDLAGIIR